MASSVRQNEKEIKSGFKELESLKDLIFEDGLQTMLERGMRYAIELHESDQNHFFHLATSNSYGYAVVHNGKVVALEVNSYGSHGKGEAEAQLRDAARRTAKEGWVGILLASMEANFGKRPVFFEVEYEQGVLNSTANMTEQEFKQYFKPMP